MVSYLSKYIKLSTQPWTGNGITNPTESLTIDGLSNTSVTLSQENNNLLLNGAPILSSGGVSSVAATAPVRLMSGSTGEVFLELPPGGTTLSGVTASNGIVTNQYTGDVTIITQGGVTSLTTDSYDLSVTPGEPGNAWLLNSYSDIQTPAVGGSFVIDQLPYYSPGIVPPNTAGIYQIELDNRQTVGTLSVATTTGRATAGGGFFCGATISVSSGVFNDNKNIVIWTEPDTTSYTPYVYFKVNTEASWSVGDLIQYAFFRIL